MNALPCWRLSGAISPTLDEAEDYLVDVAMKIAKGNQGTAATMLGLKRQTFNIRLKKKNSPD